MSTPAPGHGERLKITQVWLSIDKVRPLSWNEDAYDHLVFPADHKSLLLSFVKNHKQSSKQIDDVIAGKGKLNQILASNIATYMTFYLGQGLIVLLSGPPGTGKTLTAEAGKFS